MKQLFVFGEKSRHPQLVEVDETASTQDIVNAFTTQQGIPDSEKSYQLYEEERGNCESNGHAPNFKDKHRVLCHRCRNIDVSLRFRHLEYQISLNPATTGARILAQLPKYFPGLTPKEAANLRLQVSSDNFIDQDEHIGCFVEYPQCCIEIDVVPKKNING